MNEKPIKVLLIGDSVFTTRHTQKVLAEASGPQFDAELEYADQLSAGLNHLKEGGIDVVLLDLTILDPRDLDTFTRFQTQAPKTPIVVLTELKDEKLAIEAVRKGAQDYLVKGQLDGNLLKRSILYAIERKQMQEELNKYHEHLEELVEERTAELKKTNKLLKIEVTERKRAEKSIKSSELHYRRLFETAQDGILIVDAITGKVIDANPFIRNLLGYSHTEFIGKELWQIGLFKDIAANREQFRRLQKEKYVRYEDLPLKTKSGEKTDVEFISNVYEVDHRKAIQCNIRDITERKEAKVELKKAYARLKEQSSLLAQTEKMSAIGTLAAGTAHELNNPIMGILNFVAHCIKHTPENDQLRTVLQDIEREAKRCAEIVQNLLTFSRMEQDEQEYQKESLAEILGRVFKLLSYRIEKQRISVTQHIADNTPEIWMNPTGIQLLILNLTLNALDALEGSRKKELNMEIHRDGEFVRMTIADTGCGIPAESIGFIFDPFFTTKPVGQGTGLGLSISQGIVNTHGGKITCESVPGVGTKFTILLPIQRSKQNEQANISH